LIDRTRVDQGKAQHRDSGDPSHGHSDAEPQDRPQKETIGAGRILGP
jgi:hypothetical protein